MAALSKRHSDKGYSFQEKIERWEVFQPLVILLGKRQGYFVEL